MSIICFRGTKRFFLLFLSLSRSLLKYKKFTLLCSLLSCVCRLSSFVVVAVCCCWFCCCYCFYYYYYYSLLLLLPATAICCQSHFKAVHKATQNLYFFGRNSYGACFIIILCVVWCVCVRVCLYAMRAKASARIWWTPNHIYIIKWDGYRNKTKLNRWKLTEAYTLNCCVCIYWSVGAI